MFLEQLPMSNYDFVPSWGRAGGQWLLWDNSISLTVVKKTDYIIHARIKLPDKPQWSLVCVYGDPSHLYNPSIWSDIQKIIEDEGPTCIIGDFNAITSEEEKFGGNPVLNKDSRDFRSFVFDAGLIDLGYKGLAYTWTNTQDTPSAIFQRFDRVLVTVQWTTVL